MSVGLKDSYTTLPIIILVLIIFNSNVFASTFRYDNSVRNFLFEGTIQSGDEKKVEQEIDRLLSTNINAKIVVEFNSTGGDVDAAILIGRILRKHNASTYVSKWYNGNQQMCASSCVLSYLGGIVRLESHSLSPLSAIGIHRLYFSELDGNLSLEQIRSTREAILSRVAKYLHDMDIDPQLLADMESIPPESIKFLSTGELARYRITGRDASYDEQQVSQLAYIFGITSAEYRIRKERATDACKINYEEHKEDLNEAIMRQSLCERSIILNVSQDVMSSKIEKAKIRCSLKQNMAVDAATRTCIRNVYLQ